MPVNKSARFRFEIIDECLRNTRKKWSKADLLKYVNRRLETQYGAGCIISISQLRYDLENMQSEYCAPIEMYKSGKNYFYRYEEAGFSIKNIPINEEEIIKLNQAVQVLKQIKVFTIADEVADIVKKLESRYNFNVDEQKDIIIFESSQNSTGKDILEDIYHAIIRKNVLKISYCTSKSKIPEVVHIHPYLLKEYKNEWHIVGHCHETKKTGIYELDRLKDVKISNLPYISDLFFSACDYFHDVIGITKPSDEISQVRLLFGKDRSHHIRQHPIHHSQVITREYTDGRIEVAINVILNQELIEVILGYGSNVKVLAPTTLAQEISGIAGQLLTNY